MNRRYGIEFSNGSLGMGLSLGIGVCLASKLKGTQTQTYVVLGDGECNEGSVWESFMAAPKFKLDNLTAIIDRNNLQQTGTGAEIMDLGSLPEKLSQFKWEVHEIDGHDYGAIYNSLTAARQEGVPRVVVANTVKGRGCSFAENDNRWHHATLSESQFQAAMEELESLQ